MAGLAALLVAMMTLVIVAPAASAQNFDEVVRSLERDGYYIEPGADGSNSRFEALVREGDRTNETWYFVSMADSVDSTFADDIRASVSPQGNVLVFFFDGEFENVQIATAASESVEDRALAPFDGAWTDPEDFMSDVVTEYSSITGGSTSTGSTTTGSSGSSSSGSSGSGFPWLLVGVPVALVGGFWFMSRSSKKKKSTAELENAQKIRAELQTELDELANDVIVLSGPVDLSEKKDAITHYREATDTYLDISDELPDVDKLKDADLRELSELGARVAHARWQMDAAEAILDGDPIPEKPKVEPPPPPKRQIQPEVRERRRSEMQRRQPRPRVPYSRSRRRSGGGLLDILIAGSGMLGGRRGGGGMLGGSSRGGGGMFGGSSRGGGGMFGGSSRQSAPRSAPRSGGGVFGGGRSRNSGRSRTTSRSSGRSRSRSRSGRASTSRRRRRR